MASVALGTLIAPVFALAIIGWTLAGAGVGLAYPVLYILATTPGSAPDAAGLATAVITAEAFGGLLGSAAGGAISSHGHAIGLATAYLAFTVSLAAAAYAATRSPATAFAWVPAQRGPRGRTPTSPGGPRRPSPSRVAPIGPRRTSAGCLPSIPTPA